MPNFTMLSGMRNIKVVTVHMEKPVVSADGTLKRIPVVKTDKNFELIKYEEFLRKTGYENIEMYKDENFFNDGDMEEGYNLIIIYHEKTKTPLVSTRIHYDKNKIMKAMNSSTVNLSTYQNPYSRVNSLIDEVENGNFFLTDRFAGNKNNEIFIRYRKYLFLELYFQMCKHNKGKLFLLTARRNEQEKLLSKYLRIGLNILGQTNHNQVEHWLLLGSIRKFISDLNGTIAVNSFFSIKLFFSRF